ncbi:unnamed protein product [Ambrosiozyma monospora]|uniref:Unnamed protein product n=1 Tax=Ambrosiozyma monospora TaxID=43982 RepID=A0ACB5STC9_AMBMO|nr:unnamed protein product [Ambrosiozyma monospora]
MKPVKVNQIEEISVPVPPNFTIAYPPIETSESETSEVDPSEIDFSTSTTQIRNSLTSSRCGPSDSETNDVEPSESEASDVDPSESETSDVEPSESETSDVEPSESDFNTSITQIHIS